MGQITPVLVPAILHSPVPNHGNFFNPHPHLKVDPRACNIHILMRWKHHFDGLQHNPHIISGYCELRKDRHKKYLCFLALEEPQRSLNAKCRAMEASSLVGHRVIQCWAVGMRTCLYPWAIPHLIYLAELECRLRAFVPALVTENIIYFLIVYFSIHSYMWPLITHYCFSIVHL